MEPLHFILIDGSCFISRDGFNDKLKRPFLFIYVKRCMYVDVTSEATAGKMEIEKPQ